MYHHDTEKEDDLLAEKIFQYFMCISQQTPGVYIVPNLRTYSLQVFLLFTSHCPNPHLTPGTLPGLIVKCGFVFPNCIELRC